MVKDEMHQNKVMTDKDVLFFAVRPVHFYTQPLSNETRLIMQRKIQPLLVWMVNKRRFPCYRGKCSYTYGVEQNVPELE
jgi:hypothetical protein